MIKDVHEARKHINRIDMLIITALAERMSLMPQIGLYKQERKIPIFDEKREVEIMGKLKKVAKEHNLDEGFVEEIFLSIFNEAKRIQNEVVSKS